MGCVLLCQADVVKEIFKVMPKYSDAPLPPLDEEMLADLAKIPAVVEGEFRPRQSCQRRQ